MPEKIKCGICGKSIRVKNFQDQMEKLREHRKKEHPSAFKKAVKKSIATRKKNR